MYARKHAVVDLYPFRHNGPEGHNEALWKRAINCRRAGLEQVDALAAVTQWVMENAHLFDPDRKKPVDHAEVSTQVEHAYRPGAGGAGGTWLHADNAKNPGGKKDKPFTQNAAVVAAVREWFADYSLAELQAESPYVVSAFRMENLYAPEDWVCYGASMGGMRTVKGIPPTVGDATKWHPQFIVPNPMSTEWGLTQGGRPSMRSRSNACTPAARRYVVVEFDYETDGVTKVPLDDQARRIRFLSTGGASLLLVVHSGRKSLHSWFRVNHLPSDARARWWKLALSVGADKASALPEQAFRYPGGRRDTGEEQRILYWAPSKRPPTWESLSPREKMLEELNGRPFNGRVF